MVSCEEVYLYAHISQLRQFSQETGVAFGYNIFVFVPEVEHVSQQIYCRCFVLDAVEETH